MAGPISPPLMSPGLLDPVTMAPPAETPRNLVLCLDGTSNQFSSTNTNVIKLFSVIEANPTEQLVYYDSGVGTYLPGSTGTFSKIKADLAKLADMAVAWNFDEHVQNAYKWLMDYYQEGDRIFIFGFSRGAYTARALAGMIEKVGLLPPGNHSQIGLAYATYKSPAVISKRGKMEISDKAVAASYRRIFGISKTVNVHFIGVWDTVSSLGGVDLPRLPFANGVKMVKFFRQALALDEHRAKFAPEYRQQDKEEKKEKAPEASDIKQFAIKATSALHDLIHPNEKDNAHGNAKAASDFIREAQRLTSLGGDGCGSKDNEIMIPRNKETWFMGCHSDCGGGNDLNDDPSLSNISFRWMLREAELCGLRINAVGICLLPAISHVPGVKEMIPAELMECLARDDEDEQQDEELVREIVKAKLPPATLHEMIKKAAALDTATDNDDPAGKPITPDLQAPMHESLTLPWYALEFFVIENVTYENDREQTKPGMHLFAPRQMLPGQAIHRSVQKRLRYDHPVNKPTAGHANAYTRPRAELPTHWHTTWEALRAGGPGAPNVWED